jgi:hypothetical protein
MVFRNTARVIALTSSGYTSTGPPTKKLLISHSDSRRTLFIFTFSEYILWNETENRC